MENLKYPIGKFRVTEPISKDQVAAWIQVLEDFPTKLEALTAPLTEAQIDTPYRPEGWTVRQVVHHLADSHYNSYIRFKWTLTEDKPVIKAYFEDRWAQLEDYKAPIELSLTALYNLHAKWVYLLKRLSSEELKRVFIHPESMEEITLEKNIGIYAWHSEHHYAHIENLLRRNNWL
ncbi:YfiT family bacillithiol transferase [Lutimonas zeaxanthinifaciens]|uniref:YfiT family bacillithiol transferase n=1 Tax=Lutimonas zeaxanthinifaciens TaxID=3060215 RepID=UPI00265D4EEB|nr:bacillithiol transferase BstA [Lutimonas sp. YSD2104]WKK67314.1 bacillithiol transferase BstA [Lutimonas sp. YSD2104]